ncbi:MAG: hypothetical protein JHD02_08255 [Thermoleophilaceae bacterium]|nr:hypothetical protein [Thermoleophilaceae bacterium]
MSHEELIDEVTTGTSAATEVESIWLTTPSIKPIVLAVSILISIIGLFAFRPLMFIGLVAVIAVTLAWIGDSREQSDELPLS